MASSEVLSLAKQGDPAAIASLMNQVTKPLGISVRVKNQDHCLHLLFEGESTPEQPIAVSFVRSSIEVLKIHSLKTIMVYGRQKNSHHHAWHEVIQSQFYVEPVLTTPDSADRDLSTPEQAEASLFDSEVEISETEVPDTEPILPLSQNLLTEVTSTQVALIPMDTSSLVLRPSSALAETSGNPDYLKRPEAIVFIFVTTLFVFWETYLSLLDEFAPNNSLSCRQLSQRLGVSKSTVRQRKRQAGFSEWSKSLDPEDVAWRYQGGGLYCPKE
ncbi:MAG: hypothetical protein KME11_06625 [Timaviella obliquedivisa GSE-PSE-MK23-08B]|jgi:hypothetical protein|nr:hypothetical protein [Timaviella obliquedivisa GSE-PSE-MK23-08B]